MHVNDITIAYSNIFETNKFAGNLVLIFSFVVAVFILFFLSLQKMIQS